MEFAIDQALKIYSGY